MRAGGGGSQWRAPGPLPGRLGLVGVHGKSLYFLFVAISFTNGTLKLGVVTNWTARVREPRYLWDITKQELKKWLEDTLNPLNTLI